MASAVLAQRGAACLAGASSQLMGPRRVRSFHVPALLPRSTSGLPFMRPSVYAKPLLPKVRTQTAHKRVPAVASCRSQDSQAEPTRAGENDTLLAKATRAGETLGQVMKSQWWGKDGEIAKRNAVSFAMCALPIVLSGVLGVPPAFAARSKYERNQASKGVLYFAMTLLASVRQVLFIFRGMLLLRIVLTWFPNLPWDKHPLKASRELTDPYLNLFKSVVPVVGNLDLSPLAAFACMGFFESIIGVNEKSIRESSLWKSTA